MRLRFKTRTSDKVVSRLKKKVRIRKSIEGTSDRPRLCVFRSNKNIYAQVVNDVDRKILVSASSLKLKPKSCNKDVAKEIGKLIAKRALDNKIKSVVFDRSGYLYHGKIKALADAAREGGLNF